MIKMSLNQRIILSATLVLAIFITLTAAALDRAFVDSTESELRDRLTSQLYLLMAAAEVDEQGLLMPTDELDALFGLPSSGVYAHVTNQQGDILWESSSTLGTRSPSPIFLDSGDRRFNKQQVDDVEFYSFAFGVNWEPESDALAMTFNIATDLKSFDNQVASYRATLLGWLIAMALLLLVSQAVILRWGLLPLRKVGAELSRIENGKQEKIQQKYPQEIERLTDNINILLVHERDQKTRYRNALGDLAHSLKTPLAVLQSGLDKDSDGSAQQQIDRMNAIVEYQLQRAATAGSSGISQTVDVRTVLDRIVDSLHKVYRDKEVRVESRISEGVVFKGDEADLMELLGNLLDNAFKWAQQRIEVVAELRDKKLLLRIIDDGPGIEANRVPELLQRGVRADQATDGHGIGLSIVQNIVEAYKGELHIDKIASGGCEVKVVL